MPNERRYAIAGEGPLPPVRCARCGELNAPKAKVCAVCGEALPELVVVEDGDPHAWEEWSEASGDEEILELLQSDDDEEVGDEAEPEDAAEEIESEVSVPVAATPAPEIRLDYDDLDDEPSHGFPWKIVAGVVLLVGVGFLALGPLGNKAPVESTVEGEKPAARPTVKAQKPTAEPALAPVAGQKEPIIGGDVLTLQSAAANGDADGLKKLLAAGGDVNEKDKQGMTPLMHAAANGKEDTLRFLLENGADIAAANGDGETALGLAAAAGRAGSIRLLAEHKVDVNSTNKSGDTPLILAASLGYAEAASALLEAGADANAANATTGQRPLMVCAAQGRTEIAKALLAAKADTAATDKSGKTALALATAAGHDDIAQLLKDAGAK